MIKQYDKEIDIEDLDEALLLRLADNMAAAATTFSAHGYDHFMEAREQFKAISKKFFDDYHNRNSKKTFGDYSNQNSSKCL